GDDLRRLHRADQGTRDDVSERDHPQLLRSRMCLRDAVIVQRIVRAALKKPLPVPVGCAMAQADEGARRCRHRTHFDLLVNFFTAMRKSCVCMQSMIFSSSASSCALVGVVAAW